MWLMDKDSFSCQILSTQRIESSNFWRWLDFEMFSLGLLGKQLVGSFCFLGCFFFIIIFPPEIYNEHENGTLSCIDISVGAAACFLPWPEWIPWEERKKRASMQWYFLQNVLTLSEIFSVVLPEPWRVNALFSIALGGS